MNTKETIDAILAETGKAVLGKDDVLRRILTAILAGGHILIDDIPGVGKTTMAVAFTRTLGLDYKRMQFTPDVLPSDITGFSMYDKASGRFNAQIGVYQNAETAGRRYLLAFKHIRRQVLSDLTGNELRRSDVRLLEPDIAADGYHAVPADCSTDVELAVLP